MVYSIEDRSSFLWARSILDKLEREDDDLTPVLLLGNKMDLDHLREVRTIASSITVIVHLTLIRSTRVKGVA